MEDTEQQTAGGKVRDYVRVRRAQIDLEGGRRVGAFIAQEHAPGEEAEVEFGEGWGVIDG